MSSGVVSYVVVSTVVMSSVIVFTVVVSYGVMSSVVVSSVVVSSVVVFSVVMSSVVVFLGIRILFDTGTGNKRRLLDITKQAKDFTPVYCAALLAMHAFTRCDTTSAFKGIGMVKPIQLL